MKVSRAIIDKLQSEVASLQSELAATKETLAKQSEQMACAAPPASYAASVASQLRHPQERKRQHRGQRHGPSRHTATSTVQRTSSQVSNTVAVSSAPGPRSSTCTTATTNATVPPTPQARVRVEGARRIWGTHPHATSKTVENAIGRFCNVQELRIKRKTSRNLQTRKSSWWFVIHAEESVLRELDDKWDSLNTQTSWVLKPCSKPQGIEGTAPLSPETSPNMQLPNENPQQESSHVATDLSPHAVSDNESSQNQSTTQKQLSQEDYPGTGNE